MEKDDVIVSVPINNSWPEYVDVDVTIGTDNYVDNKQPCCAIGHAEREFTRNMSQKGDYSSTQLYHWRKVYTALHESLYPRVRKDLTVETINDRLNNKSRNDLYLLTWAKLGYTNGMPDHILKKLDLPSVQRVRINWRW